MPAEELNRMHGGAPPDDHSFFVAARLGVSREGVKPPPDQKFEAISGSAVQNVKRALA
jgi:hypothetical protein